MKRENNGNPKLWSKSDTRPYWGCCAVIAVAIFCYAAYKIAELYAPLQGVSP